VLRLEVGSTSVLLTGDVEPEAQRDLLRRGSDLRATVLKLRISNCARPPDAEARARGGSANDHTRCTHGLVRWDLTCLTDARGCAAFVLGAAELDDNAPFRTA
jgi:hypothetical protein